MRITEVRLLLAIDPEGGDDNRHLAECSEHDIADFVAKIVGDYEDFVDRPTFHILYFEGYDNDPSLLMKD